MIRYIAEHWRGQHHIARAVLVNGVVFYLAAIAAILGTAAVLGWPRITAATNALVMAALGLGMIWSGVGIV